MDDGFMLWFTDCYYITNTSYGRFFISWNKEYVANSSSFALFVDNDANDVHDDERHKVKG
ncbi:hypothetical protein [Desulfitobacterium dichloroeliminans]|uniref:hypothetical protein n=1 Tax=Desulfitobacterium dichloroeliminans TaxID=233055 RepID=UPI0012E9DABE|nr:hypothetical protein [Desulfitobacterium dichloroeliminans]